MSTPAFLLSLAILFLAVCIFDFLRCVYLRWRMNRRHGRMAAEVAFRQWFARLRFQLQLEHGDDRGDAIAENYEQYFRILWADGFRPEEAAERWETQGPSRTGGPSRTDDPRTREESAA